MNRTPAPWVRSPSTGSTGGENRECNVGVASRNRTDEQRVCNPRPYHSAIATRSRCGESNPASVDGNHGPAANRTPATERPPRIELGVSRLEACQLTMSMTARGAEAPRERSTPLALGRSSSPVDRRGIEPRSLRCERSVFPLDDQPVAGAERIELPRSGVGIRAGAMPVAPTALRTGIEPVSLDRQSSRDTSRVTKQWSG